MSVLNLSLVKGKLKLKWNPFVSEATFFGGKDLTIKISAVKKVCSILHINSNV